MQESAVQERKMANSNYVYCHVHHVAETCSFGMQITFEMTHVSNVCNVIGVSVKSMIGIVAY